MFAKIKIDTIETIVSQTLMKNLMRLLRRKKIWEDERKCKKQENMRLNSVNSEK